MEQDRDPPTAAITPRHWLALAALAFAQFMVMVDATIVNVALPSIREQLHFSAGGLTWVVNGYILTASGLLLVGGRIGDLFGRRRLFLAGTAVFAVASLTAGLAPTAGVLVVSRFAQGAGEAMMSPAAMSLVALIFADDAARARAFAVLGGVAGAASAAGVVFSGLLTDLASWRWIFLINVPLAVIPLLMVPRLVTESRAPDVTRRIDLPNVALLTASVLSLVYGLVNASRAELFAPLVVLPVVLGLGGLAAFVVVQARSDQPLVPVRFFANRVRASGTLSIAFLSSASAAVFFLIVLYMQDVLLYSPLQAGLAWLPFCAAFMPGLMLSSRIIVRSGPRTALVVGLVCSGAGVLLLSRVPVDANYLVDLAPAMVLTALGFGITNPALQHAAMHAVSENDAGLGAGVAGTVFQIGGAVGLAVLATVAVRHQESLLADGVAALPAAAGGAQLALRVASVLLIVGALATAALMPGRARPSEVAATT